ncbi:MAG: multidrug efflux RND transporter permease subunit [Halioglobus sp.]|nr:multidrug efflux RND transporter permease subunit [Halioglobus sp.]
MFSRFFIERPIFAGVVAIVLCLAGLVSMSVLPVQQYPTINPVQINVSASYPGADSETLANSVAAPIEAQINGVDNMLYMTSTSSASGRLSLSIYFDLDTDPDIAQVQVQNRVDLALPQLPTIVTQQGVSVEKKSSSIMMLIAVYSEDERYSSDYIANYANVYILDSLKRIPGAGQAQIMGVPDQAMRIWMDPDRMASLKITTTDIATAINKQNALFGAGQIGQTPTDGPVQLTLPVVTQSPFTDPEQYENIILRADPDTSAIVRLGDVARAEIGLQQYIVDSKMNGQEATFIAVYLQPGANGLKVSAAVRETLDGLQSGFPEGLIYDISLDTNDFVKLSIEEVIYTLLEAVLLVILVVFIFLQSFRTTIICMIAIVVALISTFTGMLALGFSINLITLFGLVLAIGMVVDDAIVVVENVERNMHEHNLEPKEATIRSMQEISTSLVAIVLVMASVFIPAAFLPGTTGQLYKQFAIVIVVSVSISGFLALTLTPSLAALILKKNPPPKRGFFAWFNRKVDSTTAGFGHAVEFVIKRSGIALCLLVFFLWSIYHLLSVIPTGFVPNEDQGYVMAAIVMPEGASMARTQAVAEKVDAVFKDIPGVDKRSMITGYSLLDSGFKTNAGAFFVTLTDFKERYASTAIAKKENARAILMDLHAATEDMQEAIILPVAPPPIPGIGSTGGVEFWIQNIGTGDPAQLDKVTKDYLKKASEQPEFTRVTSTFNANTQQLRVNVDREKAALLNVAIADVYETIQAQFGSLTASQFNQFSRVWWVVIQSDAKYRQSPDDLLRLYTRSKTGEMVPLSALVSLDWISGPDMLPHFNGFPAAKVTATAAEGYSSGQVITAMEALADDTLPDGYTYAWSGLAYEEKQSGSTSIIAFAFGLIIVFLVLAAQYESWTLPGAVMSAVPFGILGALLMIMARGLENDVYFQIGLLVLIGLGAKNAVLRVSAAVDFRKQGKSIMEATVLAGEQRLRPIIMTSLAFAAGCLPMALAMGAGANARHSIGTGIIGGMIGETTLAMLYVPLLFYLFDSFGERKNKDSDTSAENTVSEETADPQGSKGGD